jgi:hypothetical protein
MKTKNWQESGRDFSKMKKAGGAATASDRQGCYPHPPKTILNSPGSVLYVMVKYFFLYFAQIAFYSPTIPFYFFIVITFR